jgi:hypothetical protein
MTDRAEALCRRLRLPVFHLHGGVPVRSRPALLRAFVDQQGPAVFVSTDAGGVGLNLQVADVVINLDLPWNPARLEQRIARVHRIGSKRTVQELLLVTKESIEERILRLHDTKRDVLANIWDKGNQDVIAAPGGSGAFREMVTALLRTQGPAEVASAGTATPPDAVAPGMAEDADERPWDSPRPPARVPAAAPQAVAAQVSGPGGVADSRIGAVASLAPAVVRAAAPPSAASVSPQTVPPAVVDPAVLTATIAAVAPALPPDHRQSLAVVFRALAEALESV